MIQFRIRCCIQLSYLFSLLLSESSCPSLTFTTWTQWGLLCTMSNFIECPSIYLDCLFFTRTSDAFLPHWIVVTFPITDVGFHLSYCLPSFPSVLSPFVISMYPFPHQTIDSFIFLMYGFMDSYFTQWVII